MKKLHENQGGFVEGDMIISTCNRKIMNTGGEFHVHES